MSAPAIGLRSRWLPPPTAHVDTTHPLGVGMIAAMIPAHNIELISGRALTRGASTALRATPWGLAGEQTANGAPAYVVDVGPYPTRFTFLAVAHKLVGSSTRQGLVVLNNVASGSESGTKGLSAGFAGATNGWDASVGTNGDTFTILEHSTAWRSASLTIPSGQVTFGVVRNENTQACIPYVNGVAGTLTAFGSAGSGTLTATIGTSSTATRQSAAGVCPVVALFIWDRELTAKQMADLNADPFQMFRT